MESERPASAARSSHEWGACVVDRAGDDRRRIERVLARRGAALTIVESAAAALELARRRRPDVIVVELACEGAIELAAALRASAETAEVAIIATSSDVEPDWRTVRHFDAYVRKPIDVALLDRLAFQLAMSSRRSRLARAERAAAPRAAADPARAGPGPRPGRQSAKSCVQ